MTQINSFKDLIVWQVSMDLTDACFNIVEAIPYPYRFIFADQLLPAGISIPSNVAEGTVLTDPIGRMLHGLSESLELRAHRERE